MSSAPADPARPGFLRRTWERLPSRVGTGARVLAWLVLISNVVIVGTGGLVRLTDSGMGCSTWPYCTGGSLVPTPALGIHG